MSAYHLKSLRHRKARGSILVLTLLFLVVISLFAVAFWNIVPVELHAARRQMLETEAYFASDAGVVDSLAFLEGITADGNIDNYFANNGVINADGNRVLKKNGTLNGWNWQVEIIPGPETYGYAGSSTPNPLRVYNIVSIAKRNGSGTNSQSYRKVSAWVRQKSFADNNWGNMATGGDPLWLFTDSFKLGGDYHTNGKGLLQVNNSSFWNNTTPMIKGKFSFSKASYFGKDATSTATTGEYIDGVCYSGWGDNDVPYNLNGSARGTANGNRYEKISGLGRAGVKFEDPIKMPLNTDSVAFGVWGSTPPTATIQPTTNVFYNGATSPVKNGDVNFTFNGVSPGGTVKNGLYIEGDVSQIDFRTDTNDNTPADDNQYIRIYQGTDVNKYIEVVSVTGRAFQIPAGSTVVGNTVAPGPTLLPTANGGKGYTVVKNASTNQYVVYNDQSNGAIFATGNVLGVRGTIKGRRTIGVSTDTGTATAKDKQITINGELLYAGTPKGTAPTSSDNMLGLIGYAVRMGYTSASAAPTLAAPQLGKMWPKRSATNQSNPLYLYASIFAGRRNDPKASASDATKVGGGFGCIKADSEGSAEGQGFMKLYGSITEGLRQLKAQGTATGNTYAFDLDPSLKEIQPPFFPTLPTYDLLTWEEKSYFSY